MLQQMRSIPLRLLLEEEREKNTMYSEYIHYSRGHAEKINPLVLYTLYSPELSTALQLMFFHKQVSDCCK